MSETPRFCVLCKHHLAGSMHNCYHPTLSKVDMVTGNRSPVSCKHQRDEQTGQQRVYGMAVGVAPCGPEGRYWEPKPPGQYGATAQASNDFAKTYWEDRGWKGK